VASPIGYAHRGFAPDGAENSLAAFQRAYDLGYRYLETDARTSRDGVVFAFHDERLDRITNARGRLSTRTADQLSRIRIVGQEPIARLADLLESFPDAHFNLDIKEGAAIGPVLDLLRETNSFGRARLATFSHRRLLVVRAAAGPRVATALSPVEMARLRAGRAPLSETPDGRVWHGPHVARDLAAQLPLGPPMFPVIDRRLLAIAHSRGIAVHAWTINRRADMIRLLDLGVDGIMTDRADVLREVLMERGQWPG
jgi:glycerophosphoryl diester phosphodiesterase